MDDLSIKTIYWQKNWKIPGTSWNICGYSRSAYRTGFYISELDMMLAAGPQNFNNPSNILITHTHADHILCLPATLIGDSTINHVFNIYAHSKAKEYIDRYIKSMFDMNAMRDISSISWYNYHSLNEYDKFKLLTNKTELEIDVFECDHSIPTISYGISEIKDKLKDEYIGLPGHEIKKLKENNIEITKKVAYKRLAYVCDTSIKVFEMNPDILNYSVIFIECTFILPDELQNAIDTHHIHWQQLKPYIVAHPEIQFMLFHFSQRYRNIEISDFFKKEITDGLKNVHYWA